jgi:sulfopyruvate decarboxylase TPP-binding subunit
MSDQESPDLASESPSVSPPVPQAALVVGALERIGVTHVVGLPDNGHAALYMLLESHSSIETVPVTREGEAWAIASGLWVGGKNPALAIQNCGLLESGDGLRGTAMRMRVPLLCFISYRGFEKMVAHAVEPSFDPDPVALTRAEIDSAALLLEPTLRAWGVPFYRYDSDEDAGRVAEAWKQAEREERPVALLMTRGLRAGDVAPKPR